MQQMDNSVKTFFIIAYTKESFHQFSIAAQACLYVSLTYKKSGWKNCQLHADSESGLSSGDNNLLHSIQHLPPPFSLLIQYHAAISVKEGILRK